MIRASSLPRLSRCPASAVITPRVQEESEAATAGTVRHAFMRACYEHGRDVALAQAPEEHREMLERIEVPTFPGQVMLERPVTWRGITGTLDVGGILPEKSGVMVLDWKGAYADVDKAGENLQLGLYALGLIHEFGTALRATLIVARILEDGRVLFDRAELDKADVMRIGQRIADTQTAVHVADGSTVVMGPWCRYCPAWRACPAHTSALAAFAPEAPMVPAQVIAVHDRIKAVERMLEDAKRAIRVHLEHGPITDGDRTLSLVEQKRRSIDGEAAFPVLVELLGVDGAREACDIKTSFTAIEKAVKVPRGEKKGRVAVVQAALEAAGAIKETSFLKVEES